MNKQEQKIIDQAIAILERKLTNSNITFSHPEVVKKFLTLNLAQELSEVFSVIFLNNKHQLIAFEKMFFGTINTASVYPREIIKTALKYNAAAVIISHNHPSGSTEASKADIDITHVLRKALNLIDVRLLDHIIIAGSAAVSLEESGQI